MDEMLQALRRYIQSFQTWIDVHAEPACRGNHTETIRQWREELAATESLLEDKPEIPIAMLGPSQQGKSTLINALLGTPVLAVGGAVGACTCVITSIRHAERQGFAAEIHFISLEEWRRELQLLRDNLQQQADQEDTTEDQEELRAQIEAATEKLKAVYKIENIDDVFLSELLERGFCGIDDEIAHYMREGARPLRFEETNPRTFRNTVRRYMVGRNQHHDAQYWPLIREVRIWGNFPLLANGLVLVDLPGLDDPNPAREQVTRSFLSEARYLWLVCNSQTGITKVFTRMLREERLLHRLFLEGRLPTFAVVATRADDLNPEAVLQQMDRDPEEPFEIEELVNFRNQEVEGEIRKQLREIAQAIVDRAANPELGARFLEQVESVPVFPVASMAYLHAIDRAPLFQGLRLSQPATRIPELKEHLKTITLEQSYRQRVTAAKERLCLLYQTAHGFFFRKAQDLEVFGDQLRQDWKHLQAQATQSVTDSTQQIRTHLAVAHCALDTRCTDFISKLERLDARARQNLERAYQEWGQMNWRTLKATVERDGIWFSRSLGRHFDLNADVASAFLDLLPLIWDQFFNESLDGAASSLVNDCRHEFELLVAQINGHIDMLQAAPSGLRESLHSTIKTVQASYHLRFDEHKNALKDQMQRHRQSMMNGVLNIAKTLMAPAHEQARLVAPGTGIKQRMLSALTTHANREAGHIFVSMRRDLADGISQLQGALHSSLEDLAAYALAMVNQVKANIQVSDPPTPAELDAYRVANNSLPQMQQEETR